MRDRDDLLIYEGEVTASADDQFSPFYTRSFEFEGEICVALPPWCELQPGDPVLLFKVAESLHMMRVDAPESELARLRGKATLVVQSTVISVPDELIPRLQ